MPKKNHLTGDKLYPEKSLRVGKSNRRHMVLLCCILCLTLLLSSVLLFSRLGHYALWDDEAMDALSARGVLQTGDTTAIIGNNIVAYRNGLLLHNLRHEGMPPFTAYVTAASMKVLGENAFAARFPMAIFGLACVIMMLLWIWIKRPSFTTALLFVIALLCNVSFFLYSRQCHYYAAAMFFYVMITFGYLHWHGKKSMLMVIGFSSALLMAANPSFFVAIYVCLFVDYLIWQRKAWPVKAFDMAILLFPQFIMGIILLFWWNPLHTPLGSYLVQNSLDQRITLFLWNWRDLNQCEMIAGLILIAAPFVAFIFKDIWLKRALLALFVYVSVITILSTQIMSNAVVADIRYLSAILPLCIAIEALTLRKLADKVGWIIIPVAIVAFGTNLLNGGPFVHAKLHSTVAKFAGELIHPPSDPFSVASIWINENTRFNESILVFPSYMTYPLMFHAPMAIYAWQLKWPPVSQFKGLPLIHFQGQIPPDYVIIFGPMLKQTEPVLKKWDRARYAKVAVIDHYWKDLHRPELFWHSFTSVQNYHRDTEAIYIFKRESVSVRNNLPR